MIFRYIAFLYLALYMNIPMWALFFLICCELQIDVLSRQMQLFDALRVPDTTEREPFAGVFDLDRQRWGFGLHHCPLLKLSLITPARSVSSLSLLPM